MNPPTILVQLSDPHIVERGRLLLERIDTAALLAQAVAAIQAMPMPATAVVLTGDLADGGAEPQYRHLRELLAPLVCPWYLIPGNHDDRDTLRRCFADRSGCIGTLAPAENAGPAFIQYAVDVGPLRLVTLDTLVVGAPHGELCERRLAWLDTTLCAAPSTPTVVALHHPPFSTGIAHMDEMGLLVGAPALEALVRRHPQVEGLICGHLHRSIQARFGGSVAMTAPSTAHQILLDLRPASDARYTLEAPGFLVHTWHGGRLVSHVAHSPDAGPSQPF